MTTMRKDLLFLIGVWIALVVHELWWIVAEWGS